MNIWTGHCILSPKYFLFKKKKFWFYTVLNESRSLISRFAGHSSLFKHAAHTTAANGSRKKKKTGKRGYSTFTAFQHIYRRFHCFVGRNYKLSGGSIKLPKVRMWDKGLARSQRLHRSCWTSFFGNMKKSMFHKIWPTDKKKKQYVFTERLHDGVSMWHSVLPQAPPPPPT